MANYEISAIKDLRDQLLYVPQRARNQQIQRLEKLIHEIHPEREYPYDYVLFRITRFRSEHSVSANFLGSILRPDLQRLLLHLSASVQTPVSAAGESVFSIEEVAERYGVSTRTVSRWQANGLVGQKFIFPDAQKRTGFKGSSLDTYIEKNLIGVSKSCAFHRMSEAEKARIIKRARALASRESLDLSKITLRLSREFHRSREAVRYTLRNFDHRHPNVAIFAKFQRRLSGDDKTNIKKLYDEGTPVKSISKSFRRTPSAIYAIINRIQAEELVAEPMECVYNPAFDDPDADEVILGGDGETAAQKSPRKLSIAELADAPPYLRHLCETPLLTKEKEVTFFRRYNYCKYKMAKLREELDPKKPSAAPLREILALRRQALAVKNGIISANLRLVVSVARRHCGPLTSPAKLISDGNITLMRAVEKFDYARGNKFSTYATWALMRNFAKTVPEENYLLNKFMTGSQETLNAAGSKAPEPFELVEDPAAAIRDKVLAVLKKLTKREQTVISARFGLTKNEKSRTLEQIGASFGVTRERVRQIEARALAKLRTLLEVEIPGPRSS